LNYPVWELAAGGGVLIAIVSILHVFVSHFAVGGGLWLVVTETIARRRGDAALLTVVRGHSRFFLLVTLVFGAITGVGIWFTIALVSPATVSALIHAYLWGWAIEWTFFVIEIAAAMVYWYGWDRLDRRAHLAVGWIYFGAAWASLVVINGIVTFMLTPGDWLQNREFWTGFFNPTYFPSLALRTALSLGQAGLFALITTLALDRSPLRAWCARWNAAWVLGAVVLGSAAGLWYRATFPGWSDAMLGAIPVLPLVARWLVVGVTAMALLALWPLLLPGRWNAAGATLLAAAALLVFAAGEWTREAGRKPFTIHGYMYSTGLLVEDEPRLAADGVLAHTRWVDPRAAAGGDPVALGRELYRNHCAGCHTRDGYNGLRPWLAHWDGATVRGLLPRLEHLRGLMPAWHGTPGETEALAAYLESIRPATAAVPADAAAARRQAWDVSCGLCHTTDGYRPLRASLSGLSRDDLGNLLDTLHELTDAMPPYSAEPAQRERLLDFLTGLAAAPAVAAGGAAAGGDAR